MNEKNARIVTTHHDLIPDAEEILMIGVRVRFQMVIHTNWCVYQLIRENR